MSSPKNRLILGTMTIGPNVEKGARITSLEDYKRCLNYLQRKGYKEIDTAQAYSGGEQEAFTRDAAFQELGFSVASKVMPSKPRDHGPENLPKSWDLSLERLGVDSTDIFYLHAPDRSLSYEETMEGVDKMYQAGKFRRLGLSNYASWEVAEIVGICERRGFVRPTVYQGMYNAITRGAEAELIPCLRKFGITLIIYNPLAAGLFSGKYTTMEQPAEGRFATTSSLGQLYLDRYFKQSTFDALSIVEPVAAKHNVPLIEVALRWCLHHSQLKPASQGGDDGLIIGISSYEQLEQNVEACEKGPLPNEVVEALDKADHALEKLTAATIIDAAQEQVLGLQCVAPAPRDYAWTDLAISSRPDGRYLHRTTSGEPFLWVADTNWEMFHRMNYTDVDLYLADRSAKGFNVIQAVLLSKYNVTTTPNFFGDLAIDNSDPKQPNEAYFSFVDWVVARAAEYNILVCLVPVWGRYVSAGWYGTIGPRLFDEENGYWLGKYLGKRYPGLPKMIGGDTNGFWANNVPQARQAWRDDPHGDPTKLLDPVEDTRGIWAAMMKGFKEEEAKAGYEAFVTFQPTSPWISNPPTPLPYGHNYINGTFGTLSMDAVQSGHESPDPNGVDANFTVLTPWDANKNYENILEMREQFSGPVMDVENHYELAHDSFDPSKPLWNASHVRHGFYPAIMSGACGVTYGSLPVQQTYARLELVASPEHYWEPQLGLEANTSWQEGIHLPGAKQTGYVADLFNSLSNDEFDGLEPAREYLSSPVGAEQDIMQFEGTRYVAGMITMGYYWVYTGYGDPFQVDLDAVASRWQTPGAMYTAQWFDPRTGKPQHADLEKPQIAIGQRTFTPPSCGGIDHDWVLVIRTNQYCT